MDDLLTTEDLARRLRVQPDTIRRWVRRGLIPALRVSAKVMRFDLADVVNALRQRGSDGGPRHA